MIVVDPNETPLVSVTLLIKNELPHLRRLLDALVQQQTAFPFEVVAIDSGSTDGSRELLQQYPVRLTCIPAEDFAYGRTRDDVFSQSRGRYIVSLSGDAIPADERWLAKLVAPLDRGYDVAQGIAITPPDRRSFYWEPVFHYPRIGRQFCRRYGGIGLSGVSLAITREAWERTRFGDVVINEDKAIQKRLAEAGYRMTFAEGAIVYHAHTHTLQTLRRRSQAEGYGWRTVGVVYTVPELLIDLLHPRLLWRWLRGLVRGELRSPAELLFTAVRPLWLFAGNRFADAAGTQLNYQQRYRR